MKSQCYNISSEKHLLIVKLPVVLKQSNLDETTYDNYREFDNMRLQHDRQRQNRRQTITVGID